MSDISVFTNMFPLFNTLVNEHVVFKDANVLKDYPMFNICLYEDTSHTDGCDVGQYFYKYTQEDTAHVVLVPEQNTTENNTVTRTNNWFTRAMEFNEPSIWITRSTLVIDVLRANFVDYQKTIKDKYNLLHKHLKFIWLSENSSNIFTTGFNNKMDFESSIPVGCMDTQLKILSKIVTF